LNNIAKLTFPPKECDTFEAIKTNIKKMGLDGFFSTQMQNLWKSKIETKDNTYKVGTQAMRDIIAAARALQVNEVSINREVKQGKVVCSVKFKPDKDGCFGLDIVENIRKFGEQKAYTVLMKNHAGNKFVLEKESIESFIKEKVPRFQMDGKQVKFAGYEQKNGVDLEDDIKISELVDKDKKGYYPTLETALQDCIPKYIQAIVGSAIRNIKEEKEYSNVPELKKPEKTLSSGRNLTD
jgi:uncharacterized protein YkuJ